MGLIFLFRRLVFAQVLLGIVAFCMAEPNPGLLLVAGALASLSWYVVEGPTGRPLPQWVIIPGAVAAVAWLLLDLYRQHGDVIKAMGHFTMWLQILLLYAKKGNREYGEVLVLSLMQMIGASVLSSSMVFGSLLVAYCVLALFTLLLFHLKITSDHVLESNQEAAPTDVQLPRPKAVVCRGHRLQFRTMAVFIGTVCAVVATFVFLVVPRKTDGQIPTTLTTPSGRNKAPGFSQTVSLDGAPINAGSRDPVLYIRIFEAGERVRDDQRSFLLRGAALDDYNNVTHTWSRGNAVNNHDYEFGLANGAIEFAAADEDTPMVRAEIAMRAGSHRHLFTLSDHPISSLSSGQFNSVAFNPLDQQVTTTRDLSGVVRYEIRGPMRVPDGYFDRYFQDITLRGSTVTTTRAATAITATSLPNYARPWQSRNEQLRQETNRILQKAGVTLGNKPDAATIRRAAEVLAAHMRDTFTYDLTNPPTNRNQDPITEFLLVHKSGHCELFASALAAMCRSVGIPARVITGYLASEYNRVGGYFVVRQIHAHAWTEIRAGTAGWIAVDATPAAAVEAEHGIDRSWVGSLRQIYEHMEYLWVSSVLSYDGGTQDDLARGVTHSLRSMSPKENPWIAAVVDWITEIPKRWQFDRVSYTLMGVILFFIIVGVGSLIHTLIVRSRRLAALQLTRLPRKQRRELARRLRWYLVMLDMLERHGYVRPVWQSPLDFSQELAEANPLRFDPVVALTEVFYEIRFGHRELDDKRRNMIKAHLRQLEQALVVRGR